MLVLLIIFMVAAPGHGRHQGRPAGIHRQARAASGQADLPEHQGRPEPVPGQRAGPQERLGAELDKLTNADKDKTIFVRGDKSVDYGKLMEVMDAMRGAGYLKIGLVGLETVGK